mgnify:CR=1 FL=1
MIRETTVNSIEIVRKALKFQRPSRLPVVMGGLGVTDAEYIGIPWLPGLRVAAPGEDEWGCVWEKTDVPNMGQVKGHPIKARGDIDRMRVPDYAAGARYAEMERAIAEQERHGRYIQLGLFMAIFERMHTCYGFENVLEGLIEDIPAMAALADRIVETQLVLVDQVAKRFGSRVHAVNMTDDWGTQHAAFVKTELWMEFFLPRYKKLFDRMHGHGWDVWLHSCGKVNELVEGFIQAGADAVNLQQPRALGIEEMGRRYRGRITFESLADIQASIPTGDPRRIDADVLDLEKHWMSPEGGFVFSDYGDSAALGLKDDTIKRHMYAKFSEVSARLYGLPLPELPVT